MRQIESIPGYGIHFYEVRDRSNTVLYLGISQKGIAQYDFHDKRKPKRVFLWKQLENLYFRERKFSIEVHDPRRVSVSRRTFGPGNVSVYVWFAESQSLCKSIWSMAIAQHQFYLDRKTSRVKDAGLKGVHEAPDIVGELSRSCLSLSTHSSSPNLSRSGSHSSLQHHSHTEESASTESLHAARMEMVSALQQRYETLQEKLEEKTEELRLLCLREGELTGELPPEYPMKPGEPPPVVRKRVGTSFMLDEALINKIINKQEETVASLELEYEIQGKIVSAALRLANESSTKKGLRKQRKNSYQQATQRLRAIELRLKQAKARQAQVIASNASTMPKMKKKPRPVSDGEGVQDDSCIGVGTMKETSFVDGYSVSSSTSHSQMPPRQKSGIGVSLQSAPPSPQRSSSRGATPSESSSQQSVNKSSRSNSPARPTSGYIPSVVYTRNQYRAQHYPTLSTRGQSVPCESLEHHQRSFNGGLYNLPHQRTSLASHSLDDLDTSTQNNNSPILNSPKSPVLAHLPPHPHSVNYQYTPHHHHFKHHQHHSHHSRMQRNGNESGDRFGSLDRRRGTSGRFESRSMEHLDSLPQYPSHSPSPTSSPHPGLAPSHYDFGLPNNEPLEGQTYQSIHSPDSVDGMAPTNFSVNGINGRFSPQVSDQMEKDGSRIHSPHGLVRSASGRGYPHIPRSHINYQVSMEDANHFESPPPPLPNAQFPNNQENIPPNLSSPSEILIPLKPTNPPHRGYSKREGYATSLRPTASVNAADHLRPFRMATSDITPLRPTKSSSELPPLKPTNGRQRESSPHSIPVNQTSGRPSEEFNEGMVNKSPEEPLLSLAEGARLRKEQREREWYEGAGTNSTTSSNSSKEKPQHEYKAQSSIHNLSASSIGSSESSGSVFHSTTDGRDSLNSTMNSSPLNASLNATLTVISTGSYQPSREVSKPFEMSDFYKYSTKFRRKSSSGGYYENGGSDSMINGTTGIASPLSPTLPPRSPHLPLNSTSGASIPPPSPTLVVQQSSPAPQQKGVYQPLTPLTCKPLEEGASESSGCEILVSGSSQRQKGSWDHTPIHQAVPVNVSTKRSATLV